VRFWDSSALVALLVEEEATASLQEAFETDPELLVWWATEIECLSALARLERRGDTSGEALAEALERLDALKGPWQEIQPTTHLRSLARRVLRVHDLRAADALQLAAAITASEDRPETLPLVSLDRRLAEAAEREGFTIVPSR
jgi:predicted nucleic acid-binding protein